LIMCTFIRGVLAHPRRYTFVHGWERAELRASLTVHVSQKTVYLRSAPPLTVVAPCWRCRRARRCSPSLGAPPPCLLSPDCSREIRPGAVSRNAETTVPSSGRGWCRGSKFSIDLQLYILEYKDSHELLRSTVAQ
jgi:hypothetical protein